MVAHELRHGAKVFQVEEQQAVFVRDLVDEVQHSRLNVVELEQAREQHGAEL